MSSVGNRTSVHRPCSAPQPDSTREDASVQCQPTATHSNEFIPKRLKTNRNYGSIKLERLNSVKSISAKDVIVAIMGPAGSGKSTFIQAATNSSYGEVNHNLRPQPCKISAIRVEFEDAIRFVLVDTPGLSDDSEKTCTEKSKFISHWIQSLSAQRLEVAGILYLHNIDLDCMDSDAEKCLVEFKKLLADNKLRNRAILTTTMWPTLDPTSSHESELKEKQAELEQQYWASIIDEGKHAQEFRGTYASAWSILDQTLVPATRQLHLKVIEIKQKLDDLSKRAGDSITLQQSGGTLGILVDKQEDLLRRIREDAAILDPSTARFYFLELMDLFHQGESALKELADHTPLGKLWRQLLSVIQGVKKWKKRAARRKLGASE